MEFLQDWWELILEFPENFYNFLLVLSKFFFESRIIFIIIIFIFFMHTYFQSRLEEVDNQIKKRREIKEKEREIEVGQKKEDEGKKGKADDTPPPSENDSEP